MFHRFGNVAMQVLYSRNESALELPRLEFDQTARIDATSTDADVAAEIGENVSQGVLAQGLHGVEPVGDVEMTGLDAIANEDGRLARHVGAEHRRRLEQSNRPPGAPVTRRVGLMRPVHLRPGQKLP